MRYTNAFCRLKGHGYVHCTVCKSDFSCQHGGMFDCTRHVSSAFHTENADGDAGKQQRIVAFLQRKRSQNDQVDLD